MQIFKEVTSSVACIKQKFHKISQEDNTSRREK